MLQQRGLLEDIYSYMIAPMSSHEDWDSVGSEAINPPFVRKQPGRPKKMRRREANKPRHPIRATRKGLVVHCKRCFRSGHNSRSCKFLIHPRSIFYKAPNDAENGGEAATGPPRGAESGGEAATNTASQTSSNNKGRIMLTPPDQNFNLHHRRFLIQWLFQNHYHSLTDAKRKLGESKVGEKLVGEHDKVAENVVLHRKATPIDSSVLAKFRANRTNRATQT